MISFKCQTHPGENATAYQHIARRANNTHYYRNDFQERPVFSQGRVQMYPAPTTGAGYCSISPTPRNASSGAGDGTTRP